MELKEQKKKAKEFAEYWKDKGYEKGDSQPFWLSLLRDVYGVDKPEQYITFENQVHIDNTAFIDGYIEKTHIMIEQKSIDKDLRKSIKQSDGSLLTPFQQAKRYASELPYSNRPRWIITSNFKEFYIYDMNKPQSNPEVLKLSDLPKEFYRLNILVDTQDEKIKKEMEISFKAGELAGALYDAFSKQYKNIETDEHEQKSLNKLIVRIVFCLYGEDSGIFGKKNMFHDYLAKHETKDMRKALIDLFVMLDKKIEDRDEYEDEDLLAFPYVNGGLFSDEDIIIPQITDEIRNILLSKASDDFDWNGISPTIFGAIFESTLNPETRRNGGMHYTSIENIHKVIDPLFLNDLKEELEEIKKYKDINTILKKVKSYQEKLSSLKFLDPACGSGNFLTETYISLRRLENEAIKLEQMIKTTIFDPIKVRIGQFLGIEINDFAVTVAKTALWIAESQMMKETEELFNLNLEFLPLKTNAGIIEGSALTCDWENVFAGDNISYIMGNPPFVGARLMDDTQKKELTDLFVGWNNVGNLDFVSAWYKKTADFIKNKDIKCAFVSTNSITQGEQVPILWKPLIEDYGIKINFAYRTFIWDSEASLKAHVHCVIIGFSKEDNKDKTIYENGRENKVKNINPYLVDAKDVFIENRTKSICEVPKMDFGSMPNDGGYLSDYSKESMEEIIKDYPNSKKYFRKIVGAQEYINNEERYCLWLNNVNPNDIKNIKPIYEAVKSVHDLRQNSKREATKKLASTPMLFGEIRQPDSNYLLIPSTSSERRRYIPIGFMNKDVISNNANLIIPGADLFMFGILTSNVHMIWMRTVAGRLKSDYRYSAKIVYNNFPWPIINQEQKKEIIKTAQAILDARALYPESSLADLYDDLTMPVELRKAHQQNDMAVMKSYNLIKEVDGKKTWMTEQEAIAELFRMYKKISNNE